MQQSHFNHLVYFHVKQYNYQLALERLEVLRQKANSTHEEVHAAIHITNALLDDFELQNALEETLQETLHIRTMVHKPYFIAEQKYLHAQTELQDYLTMICPNPTSKARLTIDNIVNDAQKFAQENFDATSEDHSQRVRDYSASMCDALNAAFQRAYTYQEPLSNNLFMKIITHPASQSILITTLIAGLLSLAVGASALSGALPAIGAAMALGLTIGGGAASFTSLSLVTAGFFKHYSPFEIDKDKEALALPTAQPI